MEKMKMKQEIAEDLENTLFHVARAAFSMGLSGDKLLGMCEDALHAADCYQEIPIAQLYEAIRRTS